MTVFQAQAQLNQLKAARDEEQQQIIKEYKKLIERLNNDAADAADAIKNSLNSFVSPKVVDRGRDAIGLALFGDMPLVRTQVEFTQGRIKAKEAAVLFEGPPSDTKLREFK